MALYTRYNQENILSRAVIAGVLNVLNNNINYNQVWDNNNIEEIKVPWFYNQSGDLRFMQDFYTFYGNYCPPVPIDGNFDVIPRGIISYKGSNISNQRITSRFVQGNYLKEINGQLQSYTSYLYSIPLTISIPCELWIDTQISALKIEQAIIETFYKTVTFYVYFKGLRIGCTAGFPETMQLDKSVQYSFEPDNKIKLSFNIEIETYLPVFDKTTEINSNSNIKGFGLRIFAANERGDGNITITSPSEDVILPKGAQTLIEWLYNSEGGIIHKINAYWSEYPNETEWFPIQKGLPNHEYMLWDIPQDFTTFKEPTITFDNTDSIHTLRDPIIKIIPDLSTGAITSSSIKIIEPGYFYTADNFDSSINMILEMINTQGQIVNTNDDDIVINLIDGKINISNPINYINPSLVFPGTIDYKTINIYIANSVNTDVFGVIKNIKIV